jgi:TolA-binding protein
VEQKDSSREAMKQPVTPAASVPQPAAQTDERVTRLFEAGQYNAAVEGIIPLLKPGIPKDLEDQYNYMLGVSYFNLKQYDRVAASLKSITGRKGSKLRAEAFFILGQTYRRLGARQQAKSMFEAVLRESPKAALTASTQDELKGLTVKK